MKSLNLKTLTLLLLSLSASEAAHADSVFKINAANLESFNSTFSAVNPTDLSACTAHLKTDDNNIPFAGNNQAVPVYTPPNSYNSGSIYTDNGLGGDTSVATLTTLTVTLAGRAAKISFPGLCYGGTQPNYAVVDIIRDIQLDDQSPVPCTRTTACDAYGHCSTVNGTQYQSTSIQGLMDDSGNVIDWKVVDTMSVCK